MADKKKPPKPLKIIVPATILHKGRRYTLTEDEFSSDLSLNKLPENALMFETVDRNPYDDTATDDN